MRHLPKMLRAAMAAVFTMAALTGAVLATSDSFYGDGLNHDATVTYYYTWRYHTGGKISASVNNGPSWNSDVRIGLRNQSDGAQFTATKQFPADTVTRSFTDWGGGLTFSARWFGMNARMVQSCGFNCDDDFGGTINFSLP